jgi:hypothetical protein
MDSIQLLEFDSFGIDVFDETNLVVWVSLGLVLMASASAVLALCKGRRPVPWFCYGLVAGPLALLELALLPRCNFPSPPWLSQE